MRTVQARRLGEPDPAGLSGDPDELGLVALIALAAGGMIGSGWFLGAYQADSIAGSWAWVSWLLGGVLMTALALVMVEMGRHRPENGGLVFWPSKSSGPLVTIVVAAALWVFYALNPASEAAAVVQALGVRRLYDYDSAHSGPTYLGILLSGVLMIPIIGATVLGFRMVWRSTVWLTAFKVFVPVAVAVLLIASGFDAHAATRHPVQGGGVARSVISALTSGGVIYAYIGFQGPLDLAGRVKRDGRFSEAARLKIAVVGTLGAMIVLYTLLQIAYLGHGGWTPGDPDSPYTKFAAGIAVTGAGAVFLLRIDSFLSPLGAGVVFATLLSEEVEAMSRGRLIDDRLAVAVRPRWPRGSEAYVRILAINLVLGWIELAVFGGDWVRMTAASSVLTLFVYAMPAVSLMSFAKYYDSHPDPRQPERFRIGRSWSFVAWFGFVGVTEVLYWAGWSVLWRAAVLLTCAALIMLLLPVLSRRVERFLLYDASNPWRQREAVPGLVVFALYLGIVLILSRLGMSAPPVGAGVPAGHPVLDAVWGSLLAGVVGTVALLLLRRYSVRYQEINPPK
ncbi:MAG TPA: APC family permease [Actinocrinis sp.]|nr:APC family permease [Actinocrinis sp.]